jgi:hypothetical protein
MRAEVAATIFESPTELLGAVGTGLGTTEWLTVSVEAVAEFNRATWSPPATDTVPPLMILSLTNLFLPELLEVRGISSGINYGAQQARFGAAVRPGERLRATAVLLAADEVAGGVQTTVEITVEGAIGEEPACVVRSLSRWLR